MPSKTEHELEELLRAATPLPWKKVSNLGWVEIHSVNEVQPESSPEPEQPLHIVCFGHDYSDQGYVDEANADLAVAAVNALPALLAERKRLRELIDRQRGFTVLTTDPEHQELQRELEALVGLAEQEATDEQR